MALELSKLMRQVCRLAPLGRGRSLLRQESGVSAGVPSMIPVSAGVRRMIQVSAGVPSMIQAIFERLGMGVRQREM